MVVDKRQKLGTDPFAFRITKSGQVHILRGGRTVSTIGGKAADKLANKLGRANAEQVQLLLAKASGHYKHGNERPAGT